MHAGWGPQSISETLAHWPQRRRRPDLRAVVATTAEERLVVRRMRYRTYVAERPMVRADHPHVQGDELVDPIDAWSTNILLYVNDVVGGSIRFTARQDGELEIERELPWVREAPALGRAGEVNRLIIDRAHRGGVASLFIMEGLWQAMHRSPARYVFVAGKAGYQARLYGNMFATGLKVFPEPYRHSLTGDEYVCMRADLGERGSIKRASWLMHRAAAIGVVKHTPIGAALLRRGTRRAPAR